MDLAVDVLRKNGLAAAAKKAGRATNEGAMGAYVSDDARVGAIVEVACETDFVGSNPQVHRFCRSCCSAGCRDRPCRR